MPLSQAALKLLRAEIQHCSPEEFINRRTHMLTLVDQALSQRPNPQNIMQGLIDAFCENLTLTLTDDVKEAPSTREQLDMRLERLGDVCASGLDGPQLLWLFYKLEHMAASALSELAMVAQTTNPKTVKAQLEQAFFHGEWRDGAVTVVKEHIESRAGLSLHEETRNGQRVVIFRKTQAIPVTTPELIHNAVSALNNNQKKSGATRRAESGHDECLQAWLAAGLDKRRANYGELTQITEKLGLADALETMNKTWIPRWKKDYRQHR